MLIVDDEAVATALARVFRRYDAFNVRIATSLAGARVAVHEKMPDVLFVAQGIDHTLGATEERFRDFVLSHNRGIALLREVALVRYECSRDENQLFVFFMSGGLAPFSIYRDDLVFLEELGVVYLRKPFDTVLLEIEICEQFNIPCGLGKGLIDAVLSKRKFRFDRRPPPVVD
jgi:hypothetical protein